MNDAAIDDIEVAVVGAGPTGLALAAELRLAGVGCTIYERRTDEANITRAFAVHARTLELLDARGLADELISAGVAVRQVQPVPGTAVDLSVARSPYPMVLIVPQGGTERLLQRRALGLGARIERGTAVTGMAPDATGVVLTLDAPGGRRRVRAQYVVGCDGAHSTVRMLSDVDFSGREYETHILLADVQLERAPTETLFGRSTADGLVLVVPFGDGWFRAIAWDRTRERVPLDEPVTTAELRDAFRRIAGDDLGMGEPRWRSRFLSERRQARRYRIGRVFLAGDAAHVHSPIGGQGMNTGIQDAINLGWKLGAARHGWAGPDLLDSYERERHPVGAAVLRMTDTLYDLVLPRSAVGAAVRRLAIRTGLRLPAVRNALVGRLTGVSIRYPAPAGAHPSVGKRMPDVGAGADRLYAILRLGRFVLLDTDGEATVAAKGWADRLVASTVGLALPAGAPSAVLVRPDGYIAWAADRPSGEAVQEALSRWCGPGVG